MKLSVKTLKVLKNFSAINRSIAVEEGEFLRTISNSNVIIGKADTDETFPRFALYNLTEFLSALDLFEDPELEFKDNYVTIKDENGQSVTYRYADREIIHTIEKDLTMPPTEVNFTLDSADLAQLLKSSAILQAPHIVVSNSEEEDCVDIVVRDIDNSGSHTYTMTLPAEVNSTDKFTLIFKVENIIVQPGNYNIGISSHLISHWINENGDNQYWIALDAASDFNGESK